MDAAAIRELILEEGTVLRVYDDATGQPIVPGSKVIGHPTIACGRALDVHGVSAAEAEFLLNDDLAAIDRALHNFPWWTGLDAVRQFVICDLAFNCGVNGLLKFRRMIAALTAADYSLAATEMLASAWATELPARAHRLAQIMRSGHLP